MIAVKVICDSGNHWTTEFNGSFQDAQGYFVKKTFVSEDDNGKETAEKCVRVELVRPELHSKEWFDSAFYFGSGKKFAVTPQLRNMSERVCREFNIKGICDPAYIANVVAHVCGVGDGCSNFTGSLVSCESDVIDRLVKRLVSSYSLLGQNQSKKLREILCETLCELEGA